MNALIPTVVGAYQAGAQQRTDRTRRNAFANYDGSPNALRAGSVALMQAGDTEGAHNALTAGAGMNALGGQIAASEPASRGDYRGASRAAAGAGQVDLARQFSALDQEGLKTAQERGRMASSAIFAALNLPPEQRAGYMAQYRPIADELGIDASRFDGIDWTNDALLRSQAETFMEASQLAGEITLQKFGDNAVTVRTDGRGSTQLGEPIAIPESRQERFAQKEFDYRQQQDSAEMDYRYSRAEAEDAWRRWEAENSVTRSDVEGRVLQKAITQGADTLTAAERQVYDRAVAMPAQSQGWGATMPSPTGAAPQQAGAPGNGSQQSPARPATQADLDRLPVGAFYVDPGDGQLYQKEG